MITRGHFIGEIVDELSIISEQVRLRNKLGMTDLSVIVENFFRDLLNAVFDCELENLNQNRSNEPGLDLGDKNKDDGFGIQVTSNASSDKVNKTLAKITSDQAKIYKKIIVFVVGKRQTSYTLDDELVEKYKFVQDNIWDVDTLARQVVSLEIDKLQKVHRIVRANTVRLKIELEVPDDDGNFPTSGFDQWEQRATPRPGTGVPYTMFFNSEYGNLNEEQIFAIQKEIANLANRLTRLPRITREFFAILFERRERGDSRRGFTGIAMQHLLMSKVKREFKGDDLNGELEILRHAGFLFIECEDQEEYGPPEIFIKISHNEDLLGGFVEFVEHNKLSFRKVIGEADLSAF